MKKKKDDKNPAKIEPQKEKLTRREAIKRMALASGVVALSPLMNSLDFNLAATYYSYNSHNSTAGYYSYKSGYYSYKSGYYSYKSTYYSYKSTYYSYNSTT